MVHKNKKNAQYWNKNGTGIFKTSKARSRRYTKKKIWIRKQWTGPSFQLTDPETKKGGKKKKSRPERRRAPPIQDVAEKVTQHKMGEKKIMQHRWGGLFYSRKGRKKGGKQKRPAEKKKKPICAARKGNLPPGICRKSMKSEKVHKGGSNFWYSKRKRPKALFHSQRAGRHMKGSEKRGVHEEKGQGPWPGRKRSSCRSHAGESTKKSRVHEKGGGAGGLALKEGGTGIYHGEIGMTNNPAQLKSQSWKKKRRKEEEKRGEGPGPWALDGSKTSLAPCENGGLYQKRRGMGKKKKKWQRERENLV